MVHHPFSIAMLNEQKVYVTDVGTPGCHKATKWRSLKSHTSNICDDPVMVYEIGTLLIILVPSVI